MMHWILDQFLGKRIEQETDRYLQELALSPTLASQKNVTELLKRFNAEPGPKVTLGETLWGEPVRVPLAELVRSYGQVSGGMGTGKTCTAGNIAKVFIDLAAYDPTIGIGCLDAKRELYLLILFLLAEKLKALERSDPPAAERLRQRIFICDFACSDPPTSYNILAPWPGTDPEFFASERTDLLLDLLEGGDDLSLSGKVVLQKLILLLSEFGLPIGYLNQVLDNEGLRRRLVSRCQDEGVATYFTQRFPSVPKATIAALQRRIEALLASEGVRLALNGPSAPDFRALQDHAAIVLVNCFGKNISRGVRRLLHCLAGSDFGRSVFAREEPEKPFLEICDEAQNFFLTSTLRENMADVLTMGRSFGSYFLFLTQNISTAVQDSRMLAILHTNIRWALAMRGEPSDCAFMKPALPVTGRRVRPAISPLAEKSFYSLTEERAMALDEVAHLPDRVAYVWFKALSAEAVKIKTQELAVPQGRELETATLSIQHDPSLGMRLSRREYDRFVAERDRQWTEEEGDLGASLEETYQRTRGVAE
jgi:hypothetical protein